jgi:hypothetical protein
MIYVIIMITMIHHGNHPNHINPRLDNWSTFAENLTQFIEKSFA